MKKLTSTIAFAFSALTVIAACGPAASDPPIMVVDNGDAGYGTGGAKGDQTLQNLKQVAGAPNANEGAAGAPTKAEEPESEDGTAGAPSVKVSVTNGNGDAGSSAEEPEPETPKGSTEPEESDDDDDDEPPVVVNVNIENNVTDNNAAPTTATGGNTSTDDESSAGKVGEDSEDEGTGGTANADPEGEAGAPVAGAAGESSTGGQSAVPPSTGGRVITPPTGGASTGGASTGGNAATGGSTGGASTGGASTGGASAGSATGGDSTGGTTATGGETGGTSTGGAVNSAGAGGWDTTPIPEPVVGPMLTHVAPSNMNLSDGSLNDLYCFITEPWAWIKQARIRSNFNNVTPYNYRLKATKLADDGNVWTPPVVEILGSSGSSLKNSVMTSDGLATIVFEDPEPVGVEVEYCLQAMLSAGSGGVIMTTMDDANVSPVSGDLASDGHFWGIEDGGGLVVPPVLWGNDEGVWYTYGIDIPLAGTQLLM